MKSREKEPRLRLIKHLMTLLYLMGFAIAGLDHRYGWSHVPLALVLIANAVVLASYLLIFRVFGENRYAASTVEVEPGQTVISTGPYALVRHPMYSAAMLMLLFTPLALGSYWALLAFVPLTLLIIPRLLNEEALLLHELPGYDEYCRKVRRRLIPRVW